MRRLAKVLKEYNMPIEINVNGYRKKLQYPSRHFMEIGMEEGCDFIVGVDAHAPWELIDYESYEGCAGLVQKERLKWSKKANEKIW